MIIIKIITITIITITIILNLNLSCNTKINNLENEINIIKKELFKIKNSHVNMR